jgi:hypothetical protein
MNRRGPNAGGEDDDRTAPRINGKIKLFFTVTFLIPQRVILERGL